MWLLYFKSQKSYVKIILSSHLIGNNQSINNVDKMPAHHSCNIRSENRTLFLLDFVAKYEETPSTALSANPAVAVPLLTINGWILMQRKVTGGSVSFNRPWADYRDGFGSAAGNDNYWLGLDKIYRLMQLGSVTLRVEV